MAGGGGFPGNQKTPLDTPLRMRAITIIIIIISQLIRTPIFTFIPLNFIVMFLYVKPVQFIQYCNYVARCAWTWRVTVVQIY